MNDKNYIPAPDNDSPFERIRRINDAGAEHWSSREFAGVLGYTDYRNFEQVVGKARLACFNSGQRMSKCRTKEDGLKVGIEIAREIRDRIAGAVAGFQISAPMGKVDTALAVLA